jgi:ketosteroid isomerase-like protein
MSENVRIVREALEAYTRRDVAALRALNHRDLEVDWSRSYGLLAGVYRGFESALGFYEGYFEVFDSIVFEEASCIPVGDSVVVPNLARQRGKHGAETTARSAFVFTLRDGKISRICLYQEKEEALEAVGLRESAP